MLEKIMSNKLEISKMQSENKRMLKKIKDKLSKDEIEFLKLNPYMFRDKKICIYESFSQKQITYILDSENIPNLVEINSSNIVIQTTELRKTARIVKKYFKDKKIDIKVSIDEYVIVCFSCDIILI